MKHRFLLHLFDAAYSENGRPTLVAPWSTTQVGIAAALGIGRDWASLECRRALDRGHVVEILKHVEGWPRRLKTYRITEKGMRAIAERIRRSKEKAVLSEMEVAER